MPTVAAQTDRGHAFTRAARPMLPAAAFAGAIDKSAMECKWLKK
jgi:hypothetical protein